MPTSERALLPTYDRDIRSLLVMATAILFTTALLGSVLAGPQIGPYHAFWFRLYLPVYTVGLGWFVWKHRDTLSPIPTSVTLFSAFAVFVAMSALWATDTSRMISGLFIIFSSMFVGGAVFVTVALTDDWALRWYLVVGFALVVCAELIAIIEIFTGYHLPTTRLSTEFGPELTRIGVDMASAWFHNRNNFSFFLSLASGPLLAVAYLGDRPRREEAVLYGTVALAVGIIWANGSAAPLLAVGVIAVSVLGLSALRSRYPSWTPPCRGAALTTLCMFLAAALCLVAVAVLSNPFNDGPLWQRWQLAEAGVTIFVQSNGIGVGVGNFPAAVEPLPIETNETLASHNWLLDLFGEFGIIGAALFLAAYAHLLFDLFERAVNTGSPLQIGFFATLFTLPIGALSPSNALYTHSFWLFIGLAASVALVQERP